ncbi:hypothetical protein LIER_22041 [Lithospermum erythrorhizon]|uniref:Uncharacterized protein n=1 Tax=Lithospermum erythrorhizon TaxID=34254 RepID=A0AAV3QWL1_LITER
MYEGELYQKSFERQLLLCVSQENIQKPHSLRYMGNRLSGKTAKGKRQMGGSCSASEDQRGGHSAIPMEKYKHLMARSYNRRVKGAGTYELEEMDGKPVPWTWHASKLSKFYC